MKRFVRRLLERMAPRWSAAFFAARARRHAHRVAQSWGCGALNRKLVDALGMTVREGPFAGLVLPEAALAEHLGPFLLGVYESELDPAWARIRERSYRQILDVGSSFGYYAAGLARLFGDATVIAFDIDPWARQAVRRAAALNGLTNLVVRDRCDPEWLARHLQPDALIVSDCEGYEAELFGSRPIPALMSATLIVELHPGAEHLRQAFARTHEVTVFTTASPRRTSSLDLSFLSEPERAFANQEVRAAQTWLLCVPSP